MESVDKLEDEIPKEFIPFVDFFRELGQLKDSVFGFTLDPYYEIIIEKLRSTFSILKVNFGVTESVKIHIILTHITQFIQLTGEPLGPYSEQALEDAHSMFQVYWDRLLIKDLNSQNYLPRYQKAILTMNSSNV